MHTEYSLDIVSVFASSGALVSILLSRLEVSPGAGVSPDSIFADMRKNWSREIMPEDCSASSAAILVRLSDMATALHANTPTLTVTVGVKPTQFNCSNDGSEYDFALPWR